MADTTFDPLILGRTVRHHRRMRSLTLRELGDRVDKSASYLSQLENGKREPTVTLVGKLAEALDVLPAELLAGDPPGRRARLEVALLRAQAEPLYESLALPYLKPTAALTDEALEHVVGLYDQLKRRSRVKAATPEEARKANAALRAEMRDRGNYFSDIEAVAAGALGAVGYVGSGAVSQGQLNDLAKHFGFTVHMSRDLPHSARSATDLRNRRIYVPQRDSVGTRGVRSVLLQTLGHFVLGHDDPADFGDFLRQRVEANYFAGAVLAPEAAAAEFLRHAYEERDLSVADLQERFYISYEMAAHRFTNLATRHLDVPVHFTRSDEEGVIWKAYENDGVPYPADADGAIEGQRLCRQWATRRAFLSEDRFSMHYQYTDTPVGTFWCSTHVESGREPHHAVTVGCRFEHARFFRGRATDRRSESRCPDGPCCRTPPPDLAARWDGMAWPSARAHSHVLAALPAGTFPGVDLTEVYDFLERNAPA